METSATEGLIQSEPADTTEDINLPSRLECLGGVIVSPLKTFENLADRPQWLVPLVIVLLYVVVAFVGPMTASLAATMPSAMNEFEGEAANIFTPVFIALLSCMSLAMSIVAAVVIFSAMAGALYAIMRIFKTEPGFYALASTLAYAEFVPRLSASVVKKTIHLIVVKVHPFAPDFPTGIARIFSEFDLPVVVMAVLARIELFHLWSFALVAIAVRFVAKVSGERAMLIALVYWAVCILTVAGFAALSEMSTALFL